MVINLSIVLVNEPIGELFKQVIDTSWARQACRESAKYLWRVVVSSRALLNSQNLASSADDL